MEKSESYVHTLDYLRKLCASREYCTGDILDKALARLDSEAEAKKAVEQLREEGFLSDARYAAAFCRDKSALAGWGPVKIRYALGGKGIDREVIDTALQKIDAAKAGDRLEKVLIVKYKSLKDDPQAKIKLLKFALSRGYEYDAVKDKVAEIIQASQPR